MPLTTCLKINIAAVRGRLSREQHRSIGLAEAGRWLTQNGFTKSGDSWYCDSQSAHLLLPNEILGQRKLDTDDGVTFVQ